MKLLYISTPSFADCDFPLIKTYQQKGIDVTYLILLPCFFLRSTLVDIKKQIPNTGIFLATEYAEFKQFVNYMDMSKVYVSNRINQKGYSWSYIKETFFLWKFIKEGNYDIVHFDSYFKGIRAKLYNLNNHWVTTFHDPFPHTGEEIGNYRKKYERTIKGSNGYVLLNDKQKLQFCETYNINPSKVLINRLGIYDNVRSFVNPNTKLLRNNVLFFGRISPYKGIEYLCEAMKLVRQAVPDATLTIAGGGKMYFDIEPYKKLGYIEVRNHYVGMEELAEVLSRCTLSVCPYTDATQSGVIMTSFSLGKPVVATHVGGLGEMIDEKKSGLLVPPKDVKAMADAIISLLQDESMLSSMTEYIRQEYEIGVRSWDTIADKYIAYYNSLIKNENITD